MAKAISKRSTKKNPATDKCAQSTIAHVKDNLSTQILGRRKTKSRSETPARSDSIHSVAKSDKPYKFQCTVCQYPSDEIASLETHIRTHFDEQPYTCTKCTTSTFWNVKELLSHTDRCHKDGNLSSPTFSCRYCDRIFTKRRPFIDHDREHSANNGGQQYDCHECGATFETAEDFNLHRRGHITSKPYNCAQCARSFTRSEDYNIHMRLHQGCDVFECVFCSRLFAQAKNLSLHIRRMHEPLVDPNRMLVIEQMVYRDMRQNETTLAKSDRREEAMQIVEKFEPEPPALPPDPGPIDCPDEPVRRFACFLCTLAFVKVKSLEIHCRRNHKGQYTDKQLQEVEQKVTMPPSVDPHPCPACAQSFPSRASLIDHLKSAHDGTKPFKCAVCSGTFSTAKTLSKHADTHANVRPKCKYCGLSFVQMHSMLKHQRRHEGDTVLWCSVCSMPFQNAKFLQRHMRTHAEGKPHKCTYCDKRFAQSCDKQKHQRIHTGERPYPCSLCGKTFAHLTSIKKHMFVHTKERPHQCSVCGKSFQHNSNLVVHMRMHTGERPYVCAVCTKSFYTSGHLTDHMRIHTGTRNYRCIVCEKSFVHQSSFQKHKRVHTGEKPHHCKLCDKRFSQPGHYREHMRIHTGEKPFRCRMCEKTFRRADALQIHMKVHRGETTKKRTGTKVQELVYGMVGEDGDGGNRHETTVIQTVEAMTNENDGNYVVVGTNESTHILGELQDSAEKQVDGGLPTNMGGNATAVRNDDLSEMIKFENADFMSVDPTAIAVVHNGVLDDSFNAFSYHFQL